MAMSLVTHACYMSKHDEREIRPCSRLVFDTDDDAFIHENSYRNPIRKQV